MSYLYVIFFLFCVQSVYSKEISVRRTITGYIVTNKKEEFYFVKQPGALEPGLKVFFKNQTEKKITCKLSKVSRPLGCPLQEFSFDLVLEKRQLVMKNTILKEKLGLYGKQIHSFERIFDSLITE